MNILTELYNQSIARLPKSGQHILAHQNDNKIVVYQAYKKSIADFAVKSTIFIRDSLPTIFLRLAIQLFATRPLCKLG